MAWRIAESVVRGEIDNRLPGIIKGTLYLEGLKEPVTLELEGNCDPDLAGRHLTFRNLMPLANKSLEGLGQVQCGEAGTMTANCMVRIPTISQEEVDRCIQERKPIPTRWSESLYLEWFGANGRVLIEGASFACRLSPAKWKLSDEAHQWAWRLKERGSRNFVSDEQESSGTEGSDESKDESMEELSGMRRPFVLRTTKVDRLKPQPLVQRVSEFVLQVIYESESRKFYVDEAIENQPVEGMIEATTRATIRLARAMARVTGHGVELESGEIVRGLKQARWSLAEASENAGLAKHMGSADLEWLKGLRREFSDMRKEIRALILEYQERKQESAPAGDATPTGTPS